MLKKTYCFYDDEDDRFYCFSQSSTLDNIFTLNRKNLSFRGKKQRESIISSSSGDGDSFGVQYSNKQRRRFRKHTFLQLLSQSKNMTILLYYLSLFVLNMFFREHHTE